MALAEALKSNTTLEWLESAALPSNPPAHAARSFPALRASVHLTPFLVPWEHLNTRPARALHVTSHSLRVSRTSPARAQPTHSLHTHTEQVACLPPHRCHSRPLTPRGPRPCPLLPTGGWRARAHPPACNLPVAGCSTTNSAPTPSRPSERPPATASSWSSSKTAGSGL